MRLGSRAWLWLRQAMLLWLLASTVSARGDVLLQGFYWDVPSPAAGNPGAGWWWDRLAAQANALRKAGFTAVWIPPVVKSASGGYSVGYDPYDDYDIGSKDQKGTVPTRYGTREQLMRCVALLRANDLEVIADLVENHRNGDESNFQFRYKDAYGNENGGRFPKGPADFHPNVAQDPEVPLGSNEYQFGRDIAHINGEGRRMYRGLLEAGDWLTRSLDIQGYRLDYVKGISAAWLRVFLNYGAMKGKFAVGEYYDGNLDLVAGWVKDSLQGRCWAFDFPLRGMLHQMCAQNGAFNMASLDRAGLAGRDPSVAVTFVENHDTDRESPVVKGKMLAYAYILTAQGYPSVFYRDYSMEAGCYRLKPHLDKLLWIREKLAQGGTAVRAKSEDVFVFERTGGRRLLVGLSDNSSMAQTLRVATDFGPNVRLRDYTGHAPDLRTDANGVVTLRIPANRDGDGYVCYSVAGRNESIRVNSKAVNQEFLGARDLDIKPADNTQWVQVGRIWPAPGRSLRVALSCNKTFWNDRTRVAVEMVGPNGKRLASLTLTKKAAQGRSLVATPSAKGWYTFRVRSFDTTARNPRPAYRLRVKYTAPQTFAP